MLTISCYRVKWGIILDNHVHSKPWIKIVKAKYMDRSFRDNEPVIRDDADEWMIRLNERGDESYRNGPHSYYEE